jgi:hypothetical protein
VEEYQPKVNSHKVNNPYFLKFDLELIERLMKEVGMKSSDERVYKMISIMAEAQLCKILNEVKQGTNIQSQKQQEFKSTLTLDDLSKALEEFGVVVRRPPFLDDKAQGTVPSNSVNPSHGGKGGSGQSMKRSNPN